MCIFDDRPHRKLPELVKELDRELRIITKQVVALEKYKNLCNSSTNDKNPVGSKLSYILGSIENDILQVATNIARKKYEPAILIFDALVLYGKPDAELHKTITEEVEEAFKGLNMRFHMEELKSTIKIPDDYDPLELNDYEIKKADWEKTHFKVLKGGPALYAEYDNEERCYDWYDKTQMTEKYSHLRFVRPDGFKDSFIDAWMSDENIKIYDKAGMYPLGNCPPNHLNLWIPFAGDMIDDYEPDNEGLMFILEHINYLCNYKLPSVNVLKMWISQAITNPARKPECIIVISGHQGAGKGQLIKLLKRLFGKNRVFETAEPSRDVWGNFNGLMKDAYIVNLNELEKKETKGHSAKIKKLATDNTYTLHLKNKNPVDMDSFHRFIATSNYDDGGIGAKEEDRRPFIIRTCEDKRDKAYYNKLEKYIENDRVIKTVYEHFKAMDSYNWVYVKDDVVNEYHQEIVKRNRPAPERWLREKMEQVEEEKTYEMTSYDMFEMFNNWLKANGETYNGGKAVLCREITKIAKKYNGIEIRRTNATKIYIFDVALVLRQLPECE
jgi:hypothetical protein